MLSRGGPPVMKQLVLSRGGPPFKLYVDAFKGWALHLIMYLYELIVLIECQLILYVDQISKCNIT